LLLRKLARRNTLGVLLGGGAVAAVFVNALLLQPGPHPAPFFAAPGAPALPAGAAVVTRREPKPEPKSEATGTIMALLPRPRPPELEAAKPDPVAAQGRGRTDIVAEVQRELGRRGFYEGTVDGVYGPRTDAAIRDFEQAANLKPGGEPSELLIKTILRSPVKATTGANPPVPPLPIRHDAVADLIGPSRRVLAVQRALADFGYGQIKPTGVVNPETEAAIERFERERRLPISGQISDRLVRDLAAMTGRPID
jgi:peptidoglycan hydrolase-like protein with peptidoglycan-binding domain